MTETRKQIIEYLKRHPKSQASDVALAIGIARVAMSTMLDNMHQRELVDSKAIKGKRVYWVPKQPRSHTAVIKRARKIGHPFGIVAAQVTA